MMRMSWTFTLAWAFTVALQWPAVSRAASELEERGIITTATMDAFLREDFSKLEEMSGLYRSSKSRTSSGLWKLTVFYAGLDGAIDAHVDVASAGRGIETGFRELESKTMRWAQQYPDSPSARIAYSMVFTNRAWVNRGDGYAPAVPPSRWAPFRASMAVARKNLEDHKAIASVDPRWYETMLEVARAENWERDQFDRLLNEALDREPLFYQTYFAALEYLLPKWHGGLAEIDEFARNAVRRTAKTDGNGMYARLYWYASQTQFQNKLFGDSLAGWPQMRRGFDDILAQYPDAWNLNNYAKFACLANDLPKTRELLKRTEASVIPEAWQPRQLRERCVSWAKQGGAKL